jgi:adenylate cyclase
MTKHMSKEDYDEDWYWYLTGKHRHGFAQEYERSVERYRRTSLLFPGNPRCFECLRPLAGLGSWLTNTYPSSFSPRLCRTCEEKMREREAGAEVELSLLFADVRGSTTLAEQMTVSDFRMLIQRFYQAASEVLVEHNAMVNRLMGDQVIGLFVPRFAGLKHAEVAIAAAREMMRVTGHGDGDRANQKIPIGIGVHTGVAYVGSVGTNKGVNELAVLGPAANLTARLSSLAADGEILVSEPAAASAQLSSEGIESRTLELKGISQPVTVRILRPDRTMN